MNTVIDGLGHVWAIRTGPREEEDECQRCGVSYGQVRKLGGKLPCLNRATEPGNAADWWRKVSDADLAEAMRKAEEYGSLDLEIMGVAMQGLLPEGELDPESRRRLGLEMAIAFYHLGKAARLFGAYARGVTPSDDTWGDGTIYPMMARRVRETGRWP